MKYRMILELRFETDAELPEAQKFGEDAIGKFLSQLEAIENDLNKPFYKLILEKVEE